MNRSSEQQQARRAAESRLAGMSRVHFPSVRRRLAIVLLSCAMSVAHAATCTVSTAGIAFGNYDPIDQVVPLDSSGNVRVGCTNLDAFEVLFGVQVTIEASPGNSGSYAVRNLTGPPASILQYNLYVSPPPGGAIWGNGGSGTQRIAGPVGGVFTGRPNPRNFPAYGRIPPGQDPYAGLYSDVLVVTVTF